MALTQLKTGAIADDAVTLAKQAAGTDGQIITYDASGNPTAVGPGTDGQVLTSTGAGSPPAFEAVPASVSLSGSTDNTVVTVTGANAMQGEGNLLFDGNDLIIKGTSTNTGLDYAASQLLQINNTSDSNNVHTALSFPFGTQDRGPAIYAAYRGTSGEGDLIIAPDYAETAAVFKPHGAVELYHDNSKKLETISTGVNVTGGIRLGGNNAVNELDDYEEGTWTPGIAFGGGTTSLSLSEAVGNYTKIGHMVYVNAAITVSNKGSSSGAATVTGLPFTNTTSNGDRINGGFTYIAAFNGLTTVPILYSGSSGTTIEIYQADNNSGSITQITSVTNAHFNTNNATIRLWAIYRV